MSYDLYFKARDGANIDEQQFLNYFQQQRHYQIQDSQAWYVNEATGVDFCFTLTPLAEAYAPHGEPYPVALNIHYFRPDYFIREVEPEVTAFVRAFDLLVSDPQLDGMGEGEYDAIGLIAGWNSGNEFAHSVLLQEPKYRDAVRHLPGSQLHQAWQWNYRRLMRQTQAGPATFVPDVLLMQVADETATVAIWPDGMPMVVPKVDYLCVRREALAPRRWFRRQKKDMAFVPWSQVEPLLLQHGQSELDGSITLHYPAPPSVVSKFIRRLPTQDFPVTLLKAGSVLTRELVLAHDS